MTATVAESAYAAFQKVYTDAMRVASDVRVAYESCDAAEHALQFAVAAEREAARVAFVGGSEHVSNGDVTAARDALDDAHVRLGELKLADQRRRDALSAALGNLDASLIGEAAEQLIDAERNRLNLAVDELAASRRALALVLGMLNASDGGPLQEAASLGRVDGLAGRNGEALDWHVVEGALRGIGTTAGLVLRSYLNRPAPPQPPRVPMEEMLRWNIAAGGTFSDSTQDIRDRYIEHGPRRSEAAMDAHEGDTGRTRDQRTWS